MRRIRTIALGSMMAVLATGCAKENEDAETGPPAFLGGVTVHTLEASGSGRTYQVSVAVPLGYAESSDRYQVLVGVDANGQFGTLVETARILRIGDQIPPLIVVGIGFPVGGYQTLTRPRRLYELTPTEIEDFVEIMTEDDPSAPPPEGSGGAPGLLQFIVEDALPFVDRNYRSETGHRTLYGHSAGGAFALYALLNAHTSFSRFLIASPSLWWDDRAAFRLEEAYAALSDSLPAKVFFSVGLDETESVNPPTGWGRMVTNLQEYLEVIEARQYTGLVWTAHYFEGENHQSVVGPSISRGLRYLYQD